MRSEILRSRLIQLYLAKVLVPSPNNEADECSSMRVEDDESDYNDRYASFGVHSPDVECKSLRSPALPSKKYLTVSPASTFEEEEEDGFDENRELPVIACRSDDPSALLSQDAPGSKRASNRSLEAQRIARYLASDRRMSLDSRLKRTNYALEGGDLAVSKEQMKWLQKDLHSARVAAWRSELGVRQQISRRGSLQDDPAFLQLRLGKKKAARVSDERRPSMPTTLTPPVIRTPSPNCSPNCPTPPKSPSRSAKSDLKRREMNIYAPVSF